MKGDFLLSWDWFDMNVRGRRFPLKMNFLGGICSTKWDAAGCSEYREDHETANLKIILELKNAKSNSWLLKCVT